jgi:hypothetical protein
VLSITTPIWLLGLAVIPLVWWLHRLGDPDAAAPVSAAFLFRAHADETNASRTLPRAHPVWILRAALLSLLVLALAGLNWPRSPERHITVWLDDSVSMQAQEAGLPRTAIAAQTLGAALEAAGPATVQVRALSDHRRQFDATALAGEQLIEAVFRRADSDEPRSPRIPLILPREREHWVVSDGADQRINAWTNDTAMLRSIAVGSKTENAAVTAIMARRALQDAALLFGAVRVHNLGAAETTRTLSVRADGRVIFNEDMAIGPGDSIYRDFRAPADTGSLVAELAPADALTLDDTLEIALDALRPLTVDFDSRCGSHFRRAIDAHPGLQFRAGTERPTALTVRCAPSPGPSAAPSISVHTAIDYRPLTEEVQWRRSVPGLSGMSLHPSWLRIAPASAPPQSHLTLLGSPAAGLSLIDAQSGSVDVFLDLEWAPLVERPVYPLLVNALAELALARPVLDPVIRVARDPAESRIAPQPAAGGSPPSATVTQARTDLTGYLLLLATALLVADLLISLPVGARAGKASRGIA